MAAGQHWERINGGAGAGTGTRNFACLDPHLRIPNIYNRIKEMWKSSCLTEKLKEMYSISLGECKARRKIFVFLEFLNGLPHTDVYRHILTCRFTHLASYVVIC